MYTQTSRRSMDALAILLAVGIGAAGCTPLTSEGAQLGLPVDPPSALVIAGPRASGELAAIGEAIAGSARTGEHLEVVDPARATQPVLDSAVAPVSPSMPGPVRPTPPGPGATHYLEQQYQTRLKEYHAKRNSDLSTLRRELGARLRSWSGSVEGTVSRAQTGSGSGASVRSSLAQAEGFFGSLDQAGADLGTRKVLVLASTPAMADTVTPLPPSSVPGVTVILADFTGSQTTEAEWQADFLQAGAIRAIVLSPGTQNELVPVIAQGLNGETGPAPAEVRFPLNQATLSPAAKAQLDRLATWLISSCPSAPVTILGFADPLGSPARNAQLAQQRAMTTMAFLAGRGVNPARLSAAGYGTGLPAAPDDSQGVQPLDRRAVIITNPDAGQPGC